MASSREAREVEAKFRVHAPFQLPELTGERTGVARVSGPTHQELRAVYWDTGDLRLAREGITLRHRSGEGAGDGWHLKLPVHEAAVPDTSVGARDELHEQGPESEVPEQLRDLVTVYVRSAVLGPVATLATERSKFLLFNGSSDELAELTDDVVSVLNGGHVAGRFREIEIEDRTGGSAVLRDVGQVLRGAGAVAGQFQPKVVHALGPQATADPDPPPPQDVSLDDPARALVQSVLRRYARIFMARDVELRRGLPDAVHQIRVAARRLRSALKTFRPIVDVDWANALRTELKWVADEFGVARDSEVLLARLLGRLDALPPELVVGPVRARIEAAVGGDLVAARASGLEMLHSERYLALVDRLVDAAWDPITTAGAEARTGDVAPKLASSAWSRLDKRARHVLSKRATDADWHQARIAAKQARYTLEALSFVYGKPAKRLAGYAEDVQELLGEHQDAVIACDVIRRLATGPRSGTVAFTLGLLYAGQLEVIARTRDEFPALWAEASKPRHRAWLSG